MGRMQNNPRALAMGRIGKSPGFPSNRVAAGQLDLPAVHIAMVCFLFACRWSASEAFLFLSGPLCWVFKQKFDQMC